jgi:hypothetical protein
MNRLCKRGEQSQESLQSLVQSCVPIKVVQELCSHSNVATTMRYARLAPADLGRAVELLSPAEGKPVQAPEPSKASGGPWNAVKSLVNPVLK